jgi:hypothetical protein
LVFSFKRFYFVSKIKDMEYQLIPKANTGIASEYMVAGELSRRGYNVAVTLGNTKAIDLFAEKEGKSFAIQVKGIQRSKSICWNFTRDSLKENNFYVLVNLHADTLNEPEYFVFTGEEIKRYVIQNKSGRDVLDYTKAKKYESKNRWDKII